MKKLSLMSIQKIKTSSANDSVNSANCSMLAAFCSARSRQYPRTPLIPHSPVPRAIPDPNNPTEASAIIASGATLGDRLCSEAATCALLKKDEV